MQETMIILRCLKDRAGQRVGMQLLDWSGELSRLSDGAAFATGLSYNTRVKCCGDFEQVNLHRLKRKRAPLAELCVGGGSVTVNGPLGNKQEFW